MALHIRLRTTVSQVAIAGARDGGLGAFLVTGAIVRGATSLSGCVRSQRRQSAQSLPGLELIQRCQEQGVVCVEIRVEVRVHLCGKPRVQRERPAILRVGGAELRSNAQVFEVRASAGNVEGGTAMAKSMSSVCRG